MNIVKEIKRRRFLERPCEHCKDFDQCCEDCLLERKIEWAMEEEKCPHSANKCAECQMADQLDEYLSQDDELDYNF